MDCENLESFLDFIRNAKEVPAVERGNLEKKLIDVVTISKGDAKDENQCHGCGCETVRDEKGNVKIANGLDYYHREQLKSLFVEALEKSSLPIEAWAPVLSTEFIMKYYPYVKNKELWKQFVLDEKNPVLCPDDVNYATLPEAEKVYFYEKSNWSPWDNIDFNSPYWNATPERQQLASYASNYRIMRIMSRLGGEGGVMGFFDKVCDSSADKNS